MPTLRSTAHHSFAARRGTALPRGAVLVCAALFALAPTWAQADPDFMPPPAGLGGGDLVDVCALPFHARLAIPGGIGAYRCSGVLVHPEVIVTTNLCANLWGEENPAPGHAYFGYGDDGVDAEFTSCTAFSSQLQVPVADDLAYCRLTEAVDIPYAPIAMGCEMTALTPGATVTVAGYGGTPGSTSTEYHSFGVTTVAGLSSEKDLVQLANDGPTWCSYADQGGPGLVRLPDGSWRLFGIMANVATFDGECGTGIQLPVLEEHVAWMEEGLGLDLTPCFDADGTWNPGSECTGFYAGEAELGYGSWVDSCEGTPRSGESDICGEPFGGSDESGGDGDGDGDGDGADSSEDASASGGEADGGGETSSSGANASEGSEGGSSGCRVGGDPSPFAPLMLLAFAARRRRRMS